MMTKDLSITTLPRIPRLYRTARPRPDSVMPRTRRPLGPSKQYSGRSATPHPELMRLLKQALSICPSSRTERCEGVSPRRPGRVRHWHSIPRGRDPELDDLGGLQEVLSEGVGVAGVAGADHHAVLEGAALVDQARV